jgi:DNA-binding CsgD family transcriptional regulator
MQTLVRSRERVNAPGPFGRERESRAMISSPLVAPRLVGREDECAFLMRRLDEVVRGGTACLALIEGDAGMGKSRLLAELRRRAGDLQAVPLCVHALEHVREPYAPFALAVARAADEAPPAVAASLRAVGAALDPDVAMHKGKRLRAVATALRPVLRERPVALLFEDLHWADRASLDMLAFFAVEFAAAPLFVAGTLRPVESPSPQIELLRAGAHTVRLRPLADRDVATIVREAVRGRGGLGAERLRRITGLAGGNPLFALELLRNALAGADDAVAPAIAYPIVRRWESLDAEGRDVLSMAAALGEIDAACLCELLERDAEAVEDALDRAARLHLVEVEQPSGRRRFPHALARAAIEARIPARRRPAIQRRIGEMLELRAEGVEPARLAYHWTFAGDPARTLRYNEAAGDRAVALHDYGTALRFFETAARCAVPDDFATIARLNEKLAAAAMIEALPSRAAAPIDAAVDAFTALGDAAGVARMLLHRSRRMWYDGEPAGALAEAQHALAVAAPLGPSPQLFHVHVRLAQIHYLVGRLPEMRCALDAAEALREHGTPETIIPFYNARGMLRADDWDVEGSFADYATAIEIAQHIGHVELQVSTQNNLALNAFMCGRPDVAIPALEASVARAYEFAMGWHVSNHLLSMARVRHVFGDVPGARHALDDALASAHEARRLDAWIVGYGVPIALAVGDDLLLERCTIDGVLEAALASDDTWAISQVTCAYADAAVARGDLAAAAEVLSRGLAAMRDDARPLFFCAHVAQYGRDEDLPRARSLLEAHPRDRSRAAERALFDAYAAARKRRRTDAAHHALAAAEAYDALHWPLQRARALELAGRGADAVRIYRAAGALRDVARLEDANAACDPLAPLTPREREIAHLVLEGRSNRDVGTALALSERTVGNHLQSIFNRLGIGSRRELAAYVAAASEPE